MTQSRLTININIQYCKDWGATLRFLRALDPVAVVAVIDTLSAKPRVLELKAALPHAKIIVRCIIVVEDGKQLDGAMHTKPQDDNYWLVSPGNFLDKYGELGQGGLSLSYFNEPQTSDASDENIRRQVQHMIETLGLAIQRGISLVVGNWGVGQAPDWAGARFDDVLTLISRHPELFAAGLHLYAPLDTFNALDGLIARAKAISIPKVPVIISEFGFDTDGNANGLNGYKSRSYSGVQFAGWCIDKVKNVYSPYVQSGVLEAVAVFGWGYAASFPNFDIETDTDFQATILDAASKGLLSVTTTPPTVIPQPKPAYVPSTFTSGDKYTLQSKGSERTNVHSSPLVAVDNNIKLVEDKIVVKAIEVRQVAYDYWYRFSCDNPLIADGWVSGRGGDLTWTPFIEQPAPVPIPPVIIPDVPPITAATVYLMTADERGQLLGWLLSMTNLLISLQESTVNKAA